MTARAQRAAFLVVAACYQFFTLSDGALRMLVLLHLQAAGRSPLELALLLLPYEAAGVVTNLLGGALAGRFGQKPVLLAGLALQALACLMLGADPAWLSLPFLMASQVLSGVAKDLTKTAAKSYVRALDPGAGAGRLFVAVAALTGSKNVTKGIGFFVGGALLALAGFRATNLCLMLLMLVLLLAALPLLPATPGRSRTARAPWSGHGTAVHWLALARLFLFGSRDVWFAVALPVFLAAGLGLGSAVVGGALAAWVIGYGVVQASAPALVRVRTLAGGARATAATTAALLLPLGVAWVGLGHGDALPWLATGLVLYGVVFAVTSSLHSWLVVAIAGSEDTAERVGFYYAANAAGRLVGTFASGWLFAAAGGGPAGMAATLVGAAGAAAVAAVATLGCRPAPR